MKVHQLLSLVGFHWVPVILSAWLAVFLSGYRLLVVINGSQWLPAALNGSQWLYQ